MTYSNQGQTPSMADNLATQQSLRASPLAPGAALRWDVVQRLLPSNPGQMLEIGCGKGGFAARLAQRFKGYVAIEPDPTSFAIAKPYVEPHGTIINCTLEAMPDDRVFDTVCAFEVLEHLEDDRAALESWIARINKGGTLIISVPAHAHGMGEWDELVGHYRRYDADKIIALLEDLGLIQCHAEIFGFPAGPILEKARNLIARHRLKRTKSSVNYATRTSSSGRQLQPNSRLSGLLMSLINKPLVWTQRLFPGRGIAMVVTAKRP